ncbi:MAG: hypothetical protein ACLP9L_20305 [Thermoguttaceae bacterium]
MVLETAYDWRAFRFSIIGGAATTGMAYVDWFIHDRGLREMPGETADSVFVFIMLAIYGLLAGLAIAALVDKYERMNVPQNTERQPSQVSQRE